MTFSRRAGLGLATFVLSVLLVILTRETWLTWIAKGLILSETPFKADVIVVLGGDETGSRILKAAELEHEGYAPAVMVSGNSIYGSWESDLAVELARKEGYADCHFLPVHEDFFSTRQEAAGDIGEMRRRGVRKYLLVTSDFHTRRAGGLFRKQAPDLEVRVVAAPTPHFTPDAWWRDREGRKFVLIEWLKTAAGLFEL